MPVAQGEVVVAGLAGLAQHVVVDIGQVLDVDHVVAEVLQVPMQDVEADVGEGVAKVPGVVRRHATHVQSDAGPFADGREGLEPATAGIVKTEGHALDSRAGTESRRRAGQGPIECAPTTGGPLPTTSPTEPCMEVLRWLLFFAIAMFLIVAAIFFVLGRPLPLPNF